MDLFDKFLLVAATVHQRQTQAMLLQVSIILKHWDIVSAIVIGLVIDFGCYYYRY